MRLEGAGLTGSYIWGARRKESTHCCAGAARRWLGCSGLWLLAGEVSETMAALAPAQRSGGWPAAVGRRVPRRQTAPAAGTLTPFGASPAQVGGAAEPPSRWTATRRRPARLTICVSYGGVYTIRLNSPHSH